MNKFFFFFCFCFPETLRHFHACANPKSHLETPYRAEKARHRMQLPHLPAHILDFGPPLPCRYHLFKVMLKVLARTSGRVVASGGHASLFGRFASGQKGVDVATHWVTRECRCPSEGFFFCSCLCIDKKNLCILSCWEWRVEKRRFPSQPGPAKHQGPLFRV